MHDFMHIEPNRRSQPLLNLLTLSMLRKWQPRLDSNQEILNQNQVCYQLHYGAVTLRRGVITADLREDQS